MKKEILPGCAKCPFESPERLCRDENGKSPAFCPTRNKRDLTEKANMEYAKPEIREFARQATLQEAEGYANRELGYDHVTPCKPRFLEIIEFAGKMNFKRLGLAFCAGLAKEAAVVEKILRKHGFEVVSVICKTGRTTKAELDINAQQQVAPGQPEFICNPILQAMILNNEKTEFNILLGLCVGHDSLFFKYSDALTTVLAAKDRVTAHNPLAAIYNIDSYYRALKT